MNTHDYVLLQSPLDRINKSNFECVQARQPGPMHWKPSRFNVQATTAEGWLLLWNTLTGSTNAFRPSQRAAARDLIGQRGVTGPKRGIVGYLADRGYIVPREADELRKVQYVFGQQHYRNDTLELILLASEDCNFRCTYCYEDFRRGTMRPAVREGVKKLVENRLNVLRVLKISWFGGEPLYGMQAIEDLAPFFVEVAEREGLDFFSHMTTNGYLLSNEVVDRLLSWRIADFQITVDGMSDDHNRHRKTRDGRGTFQTIFDNLSSMSARSDDFSVVIRVNFDHENAAGLEKFLTLVQRTFRDDDRFTVAFHAIGKWGGANDADLAVCGVDESQAIRSKLKAAARSIGLHITDDWGPGRGAGTEACYAARPYNFIVGASGDLMKCTIDLDKKDHNIVGKLRRDGTLELDTDKMALWTEPAFERDSGCQSCHLVPACQGIHCPKIRIDQGRRPCPSVRRTAKQQMIDYFAAKQSAASEDDHGVPARAGPSRGTPED